MCIYAEEATHHAKKQLSLFVNVNTVCLSTAGMSVCAYTCACACACACASACACACACMHTCVHAHLCSDR